MQRPNLSTVAAGAAFVVSAAFCCAPLASQVHLVDLHVYRMGGDAALHDASLYGLRYAGQLPFTYPPFAALVFTSLAWLSWAAAATLITAATVAALPVVFYLALQLPPSPLHGHRAAWDAALAAAALAIWLEPVRSTLFYGQVDVFIACSVLYDLTRPDTSPVKGTAIGLAAAFKLTPALFAVYLLLTGRYRAAATAAAVFAGCVVLGFALLPAASGYFWDVSFLRPGRVSPPQNTQNQSLLGALTRTLHSTSVGLPWLVLAALVALAGLALAVVANGRNWPRHRLATLPAAVAVTAIAVVAWGQVARRVPNAGWLRLPSSAIVRSEIYVIIGLGVPVSSLAAASELTGTADWLQRRRRPISLAE